MPEKVALFVDVHTLHHQLRTQHHRPLDPVLLLETARAHGAVETAVAVADWGGVPSDYKEAFEAQEIETVQIDRRTRSRESGGRRREVLRDLVDLELLARMVELLFKEEGGPEVDRLVVATADDAACRAIGLIRETFHKDVLVIAVEGAAPEALQEAATSWEILPMPPVEPTDLEGLEKLVPLLEDLERRKRYLNFKYIRETVVRRLDLPERSFEAAERLLSEAIACGLMQKNKIEDKYNPGQLFTAYALNRDHELFERFGSGESAPVHEDPPEKEGKGSPRAEESEGDDESSDGSEPAPAVPTPSSKSDRAEEGNGARRKRRRRRRRSGASSGTEPAPAQLSAGGSASGNRRGRGRRGRKGQQNHQQDRVGRAYEAPSRFLHEEEPQVRDVDDDDIDEERIMRALGDL